MKSEAWVSIDAVARHLDVSKDVSAIHAVFAWPEQPISRRGLPWGVDEMDKVGVSASELCGHQEAMAEMWALWTEGEG